MACILTHGTIKWEIKHAWRGAQVALTPQASQTKSPFITEQNTIHSYFFSSSNKECYTKYT